MTVPSEVPKFIRNTSKYIFLAIWSVWPPRRVAVFGAPHTHVGRPPNRIGELGAQAPAAAAEAPPCQSASSEEAS